jgi:hypothetical protein
LAKKACFVEKIIKKIMQKSVLIEIIKSLDRKEIREVRKWLQSPFHNQRQDVVDLFEYLHKFLAKAESIPEKEGAWAALFPGRVYDDAFMRQIMYFLLKAVEEYLVFVDSASSKIKSNVALARIYRQRNLTKAYKQAYRLGKENLEEQPLRNAFYFQNLFMLEHEEYEYLLSISQSGGPVNLQETSDALEKWFFVTKLQLANYMLAHRRVYQKIVYDIGLLPETLLYIKGNNLLKDASIAIYYYIYMALTEPNNDEYFDELEKLIHQKELYFTHSELRTLYVAALNYCVPKINQGRLDFSRRAFELYRKGLEKEILLENNLVSRYTFINAVSAAIRINEFEWAEKFIYDFQHYLEEKQKNDVVNFNLSRVYFEKGDYNKAQELLTQFDYAEVHLNIIAKTMLLKIYYEQDEYDAFESLVDSLRIYLQRKEALDAARKNSYKNMLSLMKKLLHLDVYSKAQKEKYRELVVSTNPLAERDWLLKQVEKR